MIFEFPRDVHNKIISKLDIDTRRSLGIYVKLKVPQSLIDKLTNVYNRTIYDKIINDGYGTNGRSYGIDISFRILETQNYIFTKRISIIHHIFDEGTLYYVYQTCMNKRKDGISHVLRYLNGDDINDEYYEVIDQINEDYFHLYYGYKDGKLRDDDYEDTHDLFAE